MKRVLPLFVLLALVGAGVWWIWKYPIIRDQPTAVMRDGQIVKILNCKHPQQQYMNESSSLVCEMRLYKSGLIPRGVSAVQYRHEFGFSDDPKRYIHLVHYKSSRGDVYAKCVMKELTPIHVGLIAKTEFE